MKDFVMVLTFVSDFDPATPRKLHGMLSMVVVWSRFMRGAVHTGSLESRDKHREPSSRNDGESLTPRWRAPL
ncbi:hypothetical protein ASA1KI_42460 [Opitutales bacterium ASA1]|nr:hypothetical protein ASA1KI_42460 [Opitutales bacterium ASA1]